VAAPAASACRKANLPPASVPRQAALARQGGRASCASSGRTARGCSQAPDGPQLVAEGSKFARWDDGWMFGLVLGKRVTLHKSTWEMPVSGSSDSKIQGSPSFRQAALLGSPGSTIPGSPGTWAGSLHMRVRTHLMPSEETAISHSPLLRLELPFRVHFSNAGNNSCTLPGRGAAVRKSGRAETEGWGRGRGRAGAGGDPRHPGVCVHTPTYIRSAFAACRRASGPASPGLSALRSG